MIAGTYIGSGLIAVVLALILVKDSGNEWVFLAVLSACFFLASSGASAAYLTVSEIFPMETRALAIAFFYALGTAIGGITGPLLFGRLINSGDRGVVSIAFYIGAGVMIAAGIVELFLGVKAEKASLEDLAQPLTADEDTDTDDDDADEDGNATDEDGDPREEQSRDRVPATTGAPTSHTAAPRSRVRPRFGPGSSMYAPWMTASTVGDLSSLEEGEVRSIVAAVQEHGALDQRELAQAVGARWWGPGRFRVALRRAIAEGRVTRGPGRRIEPVPDEH